MAICEKWVIGRLLKTIRSKENNSKLVSVRFKLDIRIII